MPPPEQKGFHNAQRNYERYLALAQAEVQNGNTVGGRKLLPARRTLFQIDVLGLISDMGDFATIDALDSAMTTLTILKSRVNGLEPA